MTWKLAGLGYPCCHESCARHYFMAVWDLGPRFELLIKMGLS
jgi:hypothetical protein